MTSERRLEEEKADFVATISHELRTPMAAVYGAAETLRGREVDVLTDGQRRQLVEMIAAQATRLTQITEEVLLTNRLDRGELEVARQPVDLGALVDDHGRGDDGPRQPASRPSSCRSSLVRSRTATPTASNRCSSTCSTTRSSTATRRPSTCGSRAGREASAWS